jgi:hypothetical protein
MGFLSNTGDRGRLMNLEFRDGFVKSVVTALKRYREKVLAGNPGGGLNGFNQMVTQPALKETSH